MSSHYERACELAKLAQNPADPFAVRSLLLAEAQVEATLSLSLAVAALKPTPAPEVAEVKIGDRVLTPDGFEGEAVYMSGERVQVKLEGARLVWFAAEGLTVL